ncbi:hypothetical protein D1818_18195 [Aquimarina sp. BL5]|uniref:hypothetical protein n=1 Tax=Aquimarina sp. BL5 TaxID=1714860 RepID=UPI000E4B0F79|nr:hypothetical protein [Aquimarina sp. BL5]AXT52669.1 hypothetical protein D1818_18195 [Aquimarina sp. BL5]RKN11733.1 hypothetical protein D7036_00895 [Aquimarina sp. BL5]
MKAFLVTILFLSIISCRKEPRSKTETLSGTESIKLETVKEEIDFTLEELETGLNEVFNDNIKMEVDETVFTVDNAINKENEERTAGIMKMLASDSYESFKKQAQEKPKNQDGRTTLKLEEIELKGKKVLVEKLATVNEAGNKTILMMHAFPTGEKTIVISSYFLEKEESKYLPLIEQSVVTAKLKN